MAELQACLADGRVIHNRQKSRRVRHDSSVEKCFVVVQKIDEINIAIEVGVFLRELHHHALQLHFLGLCYVGHEPNNAERLLFSLAERGRFIEGWIVKCFDSTLYRASHVDYLSFAFSESETGIRTWGLPLSGSRDVRLDHLRWIDDAVELVLRDEAEL